MNGDLLMARVGPEVYEEALALPYAREMDFTGRSLKGLVYVEPEGIRSQRELDAWVSRCVSFVRTLPPR